MACYSKISPSSAQFSKDATEIEEEQERVIRLIRHTEWLLHKKIFNRTGLSTLEREFTYTRYYKIMKGLKK